MSSLSEHHRVLTNGVGKCSKPMWRGDGGPDGFCDKPAYGEQSPILPDVYCAGLACPEHGGPDAPKPDEPKVLTRVCPGCNTVHSGPLCPPRTSLTEGK